jgi:hypothetical protein
MILAAPFLLTCLQGPDASTQRQRAASKLVSAAVIDRVNMPIDRLPAATYGRHPIRQIFNRYLFFGMLWSATSDENSAR